MEDAEDVAILAARLLGELYPDLGNLYQVETLLPVTRDLLNGPASVFGFIATDSSGDAVGLLMLNQCKAIYAFGSFGEISELYIDPRCRSEGLGKELLQTGIEFARSRKWSMLEVGAPDVPRWQKTVDFYVRNGFEIVGPRLYLPLM